MLCALEINSNGGLKKDHVESFSWTSKMPMATTFEFLLIKVHDRSPTQYHGATG